MTTISSIVRAGDAGLLVQLADVDSESLAILRDRVLSEPEVRACIVGQASLLVLGEPDWIERRDSRNAIELIVSSTHRPDQDREPVRHELRVDFSGDSGPDFGLLLGRTGLRRDEVIARIAAMRLRARYLGFLGGFAYLEGWPEDWSLPRRKEARLRVPRGSFAVAGSVAGFYPDETPGGWNLLGRTDAVLWDPERDPPNLIAPGDEIAIRPCEELSFPRPSSDRGTEREGVDLAQILSPGQQTNIVGAPRTFRYRFGIAPGGAFDLEALDAANRAVGNPGGACGLEAVLVGPSFRLLQRTVMSWYGASTSIVISGRRVADARQFTAAAGDVVEIGAIRDGARGLLALRGGLADRAARFATSPATIEPGERLRVHPPSSALARIRWLERGDRTMIRVRPGPHAMSPEACHELENREWVVSAAFDRIGVRLATSGPVPDLPADLPSCGMQFGTVQWHPGGDLVIMGPDHPVTGGYLQPVTVVTADRWKIAQLARDDRVRLVLDPRRLDPWRQNT